MTCNVAGADLDGVAREIQSRVQALSFPTGHHPEFLGEYAARQSSRNRLLLLAAFSVLGILVLLHVDFRSSRIVLLVALTLPFALIGGVAGAFLSGGVLSLGSLVGFVTVLGIAARNGIMLISHYRQATPSIETSDAIAPVKDLEAVRRGESLLPSGVLAALSQSQKRCGRSV